MKYDKVILQYHNSSMLKQQKDYLQNILNPVLESLVKDILQIQPPNLLDYMINWLNEQKTKKTAESSVKKPFQTQAKKVVQDDRLENFKLLSRQIKNKAQIQVNTVVQKQPTLNKSEVQINTIKKQLKRVLMFKDLDDIEINIIANAMKIRTFQPQQCVIRQFDVEQQFYIVERGELHCFKVEAEGGQIINLKDYKSGQSFGELSLIYNIPRQATVVATTEVVLWALDRETFVNIVKDYAVEKRQEYKAIISEIPLLRCLDPYEKNRICDYFKTLTAAPGDIIPKKTQKKLIFFIEEGQVSIIKSKKFTYECIRLVKGDYFGEISMFNDMLKDTVAKAVRHCKIIYLEKQAFDRCIGQDNQLLEIKRKQYSMQYK